MNNALATLLNTIDAFGIDAFSAEDILDEIDYDADALQDDLSDLAEFGWIESDMDEPDLYVRNWDVTAESMDLVMQGAWAELLDLRADVDTPAPTAEPTDAEFAQLARELNFPFLEPSSRQAHDLAVEMEMLDHENAAELAEFMNDSTGSFGSEYGMGYSFDEYE